MARANHPNAADQIREAISVGLEERSWSPVVRALTAFVVHRAQQSSIDDAATVAGFLDAESVHLTEDVALRRRSFASVEASPRFVEHRRIGRTMTRDEVVAFAVDQLGTGM